MNPTTPKRFYKIINNFSKLTNKLIKQTLFIQSFVFKAKKLEQPIVQLRFEK